MPGITLTPLALYILQIRRYLLYSLADNPMQSIALYFSDWPPNWRLLSFLSRPNFRSLDYRKNNISFKDYTNQFSCKDS
ncbi:hypothetical protein KOSB73_30095 [Klebsiella grimontii]|uniref:Uncharacterized protein n=1 Tax=Klebsiella grimontii TaxID=2058152 RepID=A0A285B8H7_9ENTR|nr:hypothetical protein KOSB73_30095 [Klebsiella grimontii]